MNFKDMVYVHKAGSVGEKEVASVALVIDVPLVQNHTELVREEFGEDAVTIADVLETALPGGTLDALVVELLSRKASRLVVSYASLDNP